MPKTGHITISFFPEELKLLAEELHYYIKNTMAGNSVILEELSQTINYKLKQLNEKNNENS